MEQNQGFIKNFTDFKMKTNINQGKITNFEEELRMSISMSKVNYLA